MELLTFRLLILLVSQLRLDEQLHFCGRQFFPDHPLFGISLAEYLI